MADLPLMPDGAVGVTLLVNADVVTMNPNRDVLVGGAVAVEGERIVAVGATSALRAVHPDASEIDLAGCVMTPGMVDAHQHLTGDPLIRSCIPDLLPPGASIFEWSVPVHAAHEPDDDEAAAVLSAVEALSAGVTTVVEAGTDPERYLERTGKRPVVHLDDLGVLGDHLLIGHGVWLDDREIELIIESRSAIAYCPWAYLRLGQGVCAHGRHAEIHERGGRIALGCDATNAGDQIDILRTAAVAAGIARDSRIDPTRFGAHDAFALATIDGAAAIGMDDRIGSIEVGKQADLVVHRTDTPGWTPRGDVALQLVWGTDGRSVRHVWVAGRQVIADGLPTAIAWDELAAMAEHHQARLLERAGLTVPHAWPHVDAH